MELDDIEEEVVQSRLNWMIREREDGAVSHGDKLRIWSMPSKIVVDDESSGVVNN
jgi:hypothetical protein